MKSRLLNLVVILHSKLNIMKSRNLLGTMTSIMTSVHHRIVFSVAGRANAYAAIFHSVIIIFCGGQSSIGFFGGLFLQFKTFLALSVFQNEHNIPWTPTHTFTQLRMKDLQLVRLSSQWGKKVGTSDWTAGLSGPYFACLVWKLICSTDFPLIIAILIGI